MATKEDFPVSKGLQIQSEDLDRWEEILKPEYFYIVKFDVIRNNENAKTGYDICRGSSITDIVVNLKNRKQ